MPFLLFLSEPYDRHRGVGRDPLLGLSSVLFPKLREPQEVLREVLLGCEFHLPGDYVG